MRRLELFSALAALAQFPLLVSGQSGITREGDRWVRIISGTGPAAARLRVNGHGPVTLQGGAAKTLTYRVKVSVKARNEVAARRMLEQYTVRMAPQGEWAVLTTPGGAAMSTVFIKAPRLHMAVVSTTDGAVDASGIDGSLEVDSRGGELSADGIHGNCRLMTGGGDIRVGRVDGSLRSSTGAGRISVSLVRGEAVLETAGGDIVATQADGPVRANTGGGTVHIERAGGAVTATNAGGPIIVGKAGGIVIARNMAGPVQVGAAAGVQCESGSGGIRLSHISGPMRVSTMMGNILANLLGSKPSDSFLATGGGDVTVLIPSNLGVTIRAENRMADTIERIRSEFQEIPVRRQGMQLVAEGSVNGGGPLLRISAMAGTIFIKRQ